MSITFFSVKCNFDSIKMWWWYSGKSLPGEAPEWWIVKENLQKRADLINWTRGRWNVYWDQEWMLSLLQKISWKLQCPSVQTLRQTQCVSKMCLKICSSNKRELQELGTKIQWAAGKIKKPKAVLQHHTKPIFALRENHLVNISLENSSCQERIWEGVLRTVEI